MTWKWARAAVALWRVGLFVACVLGMPVAANDLARDFENPPDTARMWTWWFWLGDKVDKSSITADLVALKEQGLAGVTVYSISGPGVSGKGPNYMSSEWRELWKHTLKEADRLGLGVGTMLCSGWNAGGPWIKPEQACKRYVHTELIKEGPQHFKGKLPHPGSDQRFYRDVAVQAFPVSEESGLTLSASSSHEKYPVVNAKDGDGGSFWVSNGEKPNEGPSKDKPEWLLVDLGESPTAKKVTFQPRPGYGPKDAEVQISEDGTTFTVLKAFVMERDQAAEIHLPDKPARYIRLFVTSTYSPQSENVQVCEVLVDDTPLRRGGPLLALKALNDAVSGDAPTKDINGAVLMPLPPEEQGVAIDPAAVVDLTARCDADGVLDWEVPAGKWKVLRTGVTLTGDMTSWSSPTGVGFESDPLDAAAIELQFANVAAALVEDAGPLAGSVFRSVQIDSWELDHPNWTAGLIEGFKKCRGYDPLPYLPVLSGQLVESADASDRFLYDYRKTVGDLVAENYFGRLSALAEAKGLVQQSEAGGVCYPKSMALDGLKNLGRCAIPMGEFWHDGTWVEDNQNKNGKQTASAAHLYGKRIAAAEAFSSFIHWADSPASLKPTADRAFCEGFNQFFIFSSATRSEDGWPGTEFCAGTHFNRKLTWWSQARCFSDYIARCSHLLQQGLFVGDVLFYNGDGCPNFVGPKHVDPSLGFGYDYDVCNTEIILTRLSVKDGRVVLPDGMTYRLLVLPERSDMPVDVLAKLKELVAAGMTLVGPRPDHAPGLKDYPQCDGQVKAMADELWGDCDGTRVQEHAFGKGRVVWGKAVRDVLNASGVGPDFAHDGAADTHLDWIHRRTDGADIYFIANRSNRVEKAVCTFRVCGKQPEIWDPVTGLRRDAVAFHQSATAVSLPLAFSPCGSLFVIFRRAARPDATGKADSNFPKLSTVLEMKGAWTVKFDARWGGPASVEFPELADWTVRPEEGIRYYSGKATYVKTFELTEPQCANKDRLYLDLGDLNAVAEVRLNGQSLGILWIKPYQVAIGKAAKPGTNALEVDVVNLWPNRLIGDGKLPIEKRYTQTNIDVFYKGEHRLLPSGLLGPVRLLEQEDIHPVTLGFFDFETPALTGWVGAEGEAAVSTDRPASGKGCLRFELSGKTSGQVFRGFNLPAVKQPKARMVRISFAVRSGSVPAGATSISLLQTFDPGREPEWIEWNRPVWTDVPVRQEWTRFSMQGLVGPEVRSLNLYLNLSSPSKTGEVFIDDLNVELLDRGLRLDLDWQKYVFAEETKQIDVIVSSPEKLKSGQVVLSDEEGRIVGRKNISRGEAAAVVPLPTRGYYLVNMQGEYDDGITCQSSLPLAVVGPRIPDAERLKSRFGFSGAGYSFLDAGARWDRRRAGLELKEFETAAKEGFTKPLPKALYEVSDDYSSVYYLWPQPAWLQDRKGLAPPASPFDICPMKDWDTFRDLVAYAVKNLSKKPPEYIEVANEPEGSLKGPWSLLVRYHEEMAKGIKSVSPTTQVIGPCLCTIKIDELKVLHELGLFDILDGLAIHAYVESTPPEQEFIQRVRDLKQYMKSIGKEKMPIFFTEYGWPVPPGDWQKPVDPLTQARYCSRSLILLAAEEIDAVFWFCYRCADPSDGAYGYGLFNWEWTPRPSYPAYAAAVRSLTNTTGPGRVFRVTPTGYLALFNRYGNTLAAVWDTGKKAELFLPKPWKQGRDMMGRPVKEPAGSTVDISPSPLFVEFPGLDFYSVKEVNSLQARQGKDFPLPFTPVWTPRPLTVENGRLRIPADAPKGPYLLLGKVDAVWQAVTVHVTAPLEIVDGKAFEQDDEK